MAVINNPSLHQAALKVVSAPGFSVNGAGAARQALHRIEELIPEGPLRKQAWDALVIRWLQDEHAAYLRDQRSYPEIPATQPKLVAGNVLRDDSEPQTPEAVSELKFRSESLGWERPGPERPAPPSAPPARPVQPAASQAASPRPAEPAPVTVTNIADRPQPAVPVQQPSRKVASYQQMFPELAFRVQAPGGAKPLAEFTGQDIAFRRGELARQRQAWRTANAGDESRVEERDRLNAKDRVRIAERAQHIGGAEAEEQRLKLAEHEIEQYEVTSIGELPPEALAACGFKRRVA